MRVKITPSALAGGVSAPPSKSYTHRALILALLATGESIIEDFLWADDTLYTIDACHSLGARLQYQGKALKIAGTKGKLTVDPGRERIFVGNSGSTIRLMAPLAALAQTRVIFDGDERLRQRPIGDLLSALQSLGVQARSIKDNGCPPIEIRGGRLAGGEAVISGMTSSQHISSLLMIAPYAENDLTIRVIDGLHSRPYLDITLDLMREFGVKVGNYDYEKFFIKSGQMYQGRCYRVEGDYSSAAYFFAAAAIGKQPITVGNLKANSLQGDRYFLDILTRMGCRVDYHDDQVRVSRGKELTGITIDMGDYPDIVQTLAVVAAYACGETKIMNIGHLRYKETDRINHTAVELGRMGIKVRVTETTMFIEGGKTKGAQIEAHNDHRMAMSFAIAALFANGDTVINGAEAVKKSYPQFFVDLGKIGARVEELP